MTQAVEIASLVGSITSLIVGVMAIWLVVMFYRMTSQLWEKGEAASRRVDLAVERLEALVGKLGEEVPGLVALEGRLQAEIAQLRQEVDGKLGPLADRTVQTEAALTDLRRQVMPVIAVISGEPGRREERGASGPVAPNRG